MKTNNKNLLIMGMSHVGAISRAINESEKDEIDVVNLNAKDGILDRENKRIYFEKRSWGNPETVCLTISGNFHHIFGLFENPVPFRVGDSNTGSVPRDTSLHFVPYDLIYSHFEENLKAAMNYLEQIHSRFKGANFVHLCSPPPISDEDFLKDNLGQYFEKNKGRNFAPADLRMILYNMQSDIYASYAKKLNATFLQPPSSTLDGLGFLAREYWNIDPTHGNTAYGRLVLDQIKELKGDVA